MYSLYLYVQRLDIELNLCVIPEVTGFNTGRSFLTILDIKLIIVTWKKYYLNVYYKCSNRNMFQIEPHYIWTYTVSFHYHIDIHYLYDLQGMNKNYK